MRRLGLIINPVAGMGGRVGLKGTDGAEILARARALGAEPRAPERAAAALERLAPLRGQFELLTYPAEMGASVARQCGFAPTIIGAITPGATTSADTRRAARDLLALGVDLLLFAGGDGTARDICHAVGDQVVAIGIPAGVKIHSAVYARGPHSAGDLAALYLQGRTAAPRPAEVMDIDEAAFRKGRVSARLYGYLRVPHEQRYLQSLKAGGQASQEAVLRGIARAVVDQMEEGVRYVVGPGTTTRPILELLGLPKTLLGVDVVQDRRLIAADVSEPELYQLLQGRPARIVVTPIGGQGFIFGRGNQQLSPRIIRAVGRENLIVVAALEKLIALRGEPLLADTGDAALDGALSGYLRVITGYGEAVMYRLSG